MASSEPRDADRSLTALWRRLALFLFTLALGWIGLEWVLVTSPNSMSIKREALSAIAGEVDTLVLGSSETYYGVNPRALSGTAFNLASNAQTLYCDLELVKTVLPKLPRLRRVYVLVNYLSLYSQLYDHPEEYRQYSYLHEWGMPLQRRIDYLDLRVVSRVLLYTPHAALERLFAGRLLPRDRRIDDRGWYRVPEEDRWGLEAADAAGRLSIHHGFMRLAHMKSNVATLENLVLLLQSRRVEVLLITTPVYSTYRAQMKPQMWEPAKATYERIAASHGIRYLNFLADPRFTAADFEDSDHLNADGAVRFARLLDQEASGTGGTAGPPAPGPGPPSGGPG